MGETCVLDAGYAVIQDDRSKNWFWDYQDIFFSDLSANAKIVRLCLAMHADHKNRSAFPSLNTMAKECNLSKHSVIKAIRELEDKAWITRQQRKLPSSNFASTIYVLLSPPIVLAENNSPETQKGGSAPDALPPQTGGGWCITETTPLETPPIDKGVVPQMHHPANLEGGSAPDAQPWCTTETGVVSQMHKGSAPDAPEQDPFNKIQRTGFNEQQTNGVVGCYPVSEKINDEAISASASDRERKAEEVDRVVGEINSRLGVDTRDALRVAMALVPEFGAKPVLDALVVAEKTKNPIENLTLFLRAAIARNWEPPVKVPTRQERIINTKRKKYVGIYGDLYQKGGEG